MWRDLLELARWAPSPHNIQPWRLRAIGDEDAELLYEKTCCLDSVTANTRHPLTSPTTQR